MNASRALFLLLIFLPTSAFVWVFPSYIVLVLFLGLSIFLVRRHGLDSLTRFIKSWGAMALFWVTLSTLATGIVTWEITNAALFEALALFIRLLTLFLCAAFLNYEVSAVALARAFSSLLRPVFKEKASSISLAVLLTARALVRKIESLKRFQSGLKIRFSNKGMVFRLRLLLLRLIEEIDTSTDKLTEAVYLRGLEKDEFWSAHIKLTRKERLSVLFIFFTESALVFATSYFGAIFSL